MPNPKDDLPLVRSRAKPVIVSYQSLPPSSWPIILPSLEATLPLRNLHWKSSGTNRAVRTIQSLEVELRPFGEEGTGLLERPYLHLLFVTCDDNEIYRAVVRTQIREWADAVIAKHHQEYLIVHVTSGRVAGTKFYQRKGLVVDKIRADFNTGKRDRCIQVAQNEGEDDPTAWAEFTVKVKEAILATFDTNVALYEEDVRKADSQRQLQGWQYGTFFLQKEALADSFEAMTLLEDALIQYDELEASFFQTLKENNGAWFGKVGGETPGDDALPLLCTTNKPYRALILSNSISTFDFRIYLFARQAALLSELGRISDVAKRGEYFISTFARTLRENEATLGRNFVESWTYSACLNVVDECQRWVDQTRIDTRVVAGFVAVKAELLELARKQLDKIGIEAGHLPSVHPFSMSLSESLPQAAVAPSTPSSEPARDPVSRPDLLSAITSVTSFDKLYIDLTNRSIQAYTKSKRKRCSLKLHASLSALEVMRERKSSGQQLYARLPAHYVDLRWVKIESSLLTQCTALQESLEMEKERLLSTLALVRAGIEYGSTDWVLGDEKEQREKESKSSQLMAAVYELSGKLTKDFAAIAFPTFSMRLKSEKGSTAMNEDGVNVSIVITSLLPCTINIDEVRLKFSSSDGEQIWFTSPGCSLPSGESTVTLFCPTAITGKLALELSQIRYSRIIFQYSHRPVSANNLAPDPRNTPSNTMAAQPVVYFPRDRQALDVYMELPKALHLDEDRTAILCVATGRNQLVKVSLKLSCGNGETSFDMAAATVLKGTATIGPVSADGSLLLEDVPASSIIKLLLPIVGALRDPNLDINIVAGYFTSSRPSTRRTLKRTVQYPIALPLAVNVQDFFRKDCLLSKFSVTTDGVRGLRIKSAVLEGTNGVTVNPCRTTDAPTITILPLQTANFLFKIVRGEKQSGGNAAALRLTLTYCSIHEELIARVKDTITSMIPASTPADDSSWIVRTTTGAVESVTSLHQYSVNGRLDHLEFDLENWVGVVNAHFSDEGQRVEVLECIRGAYNMLACAPPMEVTSAWRTISIPVDLPALSILNLVRINTPFKRTEIGQAIPVVLSIKPTLSWAASPMNAPLLLSYDVTTNFEDWLVSGRKKGEIVAEDGVPIEIELTIIPLRPGALFLPSITIRPLSTDGGLTCETQHLNAGETIEILPALARKTFSIELEGRREGVY